jgi:hypothetical protein
MPDELVPTSPSARPLFSVAPPVDGLNVLRMVVSPCPSHAAGIDVIGYDVAIVAELFIAESALAVLVNNLLVQQFAHFRIRADLPVASRVLGIVDAMDSHLTLPSFSRNRFPAAAEQGTVNRTELIPTESHSFLQIVVAARRE